MTLVWAPGHPRMMPPEELRGMGDALRTARRVFLDRKNPLGLAYTLFGSGTLRFCPPPLP